MKGILVTNDPKLVTTLGEYLEDDWIVVASACEKLIEFYPFPTT